MPPPTKSRRRLGYAIALIGALSVIFSGIARADEFYTLSAEQPYHDLPLQVGALDVVLHSDQSCSQVTIDPYLQVRFNDAVIVQDDDGAHNWQNDCVASRLQFQVPESGYVLRVMSCCSRFYGRVRLEFLQSGVVTTTSTALQPPQTIPEPSTTAPQEETTTTTSTTSTTTTTTLPPTTTTTLPPTTTTTSTTTTTWLPTTTTTEPPPPTATDAPTTVPTPAPTFASSTTAPQTTTTSSTQPPLPEPTTTTSSTAVPDTTTTVDSLPPVDPPPTTDAIASPAAQRFGPKTKYRLKLPFVALNIEVTPEQRQTVIVVNVVQTIIGSAVAAGAGPSRKRS